MIQLQRTRTAPAIVAKYTMPVLLKWEQELIDMAKLVSNKKTPYSFKEDYWKAAKRQLIAESFGKCAYCEAPTNTVAHGDVEHFRPKSRYWWLAYCYDNYLYACQICNQKFKGDEFPVTGTRWIEPNLATVAAGELGVDPLGGPTALNTFLQISAQEQADLPNPYYVDPESFFIWRADDILKEVEILPNPTHPDAARMHRAVEQYYGLNRKELKGLRYQAYAKFEVLKLASKLNTLSAELARKVELQVQQSKMPEAWFAGMNRYFDTII
jgi:hypothetical protein